MVWWIVLAVVAVVVALTWWFSGRQRAAVNDAEAQRRQKLNGGNDFGHPGGGV